jgi:hypothetical protein
MATKSVDLTIESHYSVWNGVANLLNSSHAIYWGVCPTFAFVILCVIFRAFNFNEKTKAGTLQADFFSYEAVCLVCVSYLSFYGWSIWLGYTGDINELHSKGAYVDSGLVINHVVAPMFFYQLFNFGACLYIKDFRDFPGLAHHAIAAVSALFSAGPFWVYYAVYYFGCSEISSVPLVFVEIFSKFPTYRHFFPNVNFYCRVMFASLFIVVRVIYFPILGISYWVDSARLLIRGEVHSYFVFCFCVFAQIFMTGLQLFWGNKMLGFVNKSFSAARINSSADLESKSNLFIK